MGMAARVIQTQNRASRCGHRTRKPLNISGLWRIAKLLWRKNRFLYCINDLKIIDPPYNTGNDFVYNDDFADPLARYREITAQTTKSNPEAMGRFHTNWLNMIYPRLRLAANLLRDDGVCFISIDDNEIHNLRKICDEIFGEENFVSQFVWQRAFSPKNDARYVSNSHDYVVMYAKSLSNFQIGRLPRTEEANARYQNPDNDPRGVWMSSDMSVKTYTPENDYPITAPSGRVIEPPAGRCWRLSKNTFFESLQDNRIWFGDDGNNTPRIKRFLHELKHDGLVPQSILFHKDVGHSQEGAQELSKLIEMGGFDGPKPVRLIRHLLTLANTDKDSIVLDFFSGSATTAHAVFQLNSEDNGNRRFIMVQLPEPTAEKSEAHKAGYKNICEIGKERIRRAGQKILESQPVTNCNRLNPEERQTEKKAVDIGFKVFKLDSSNLKQWDDSPIKGEDAEQQLEARIKAMLDIIKPDRSEPDIVYEIMLKLGQELTQPVIPLDINGKTVYGVGTGIGQEVKFIVCFAPGITPEDAEAMAEYAPGRIIFANACFGNSEEKTNVKLTLKDKGIVMKAL